MLKLANFPDSALTTIPPSPSREFDDDVELESRRDQVIHIFESLFHGEKVFLPPIEMQGSHLVAIGNPRRVLVPTPSHLSLISRPPSTHALHAL